MSFETGNLPSVLIVPPGLGVKTVKELVALAKARPGQLNFGSAGPGSSAHLAAELFKMVSGVNIVHIPYKGTGPATSDLLGGQIPLMFNNLPPSLPLVKLCKLVKPVPLVLTANTVPESALPPYCDVP